MRRRSASSALGTPRCCEDIYFFTVFTAALDEQPFSDIHSQGRKNESRRFSPPQRWGSWAYNTRALHQRCPRPGHYDRGWRKGVAQVSRPARNEGRSMSSGPDTGMQWTQEDIDGETAAARKLQKHFGRTRSISSSRRPSKMSSSRPRSSCCGTTCRLPVLRMSR